MTLKKVVEEILSVQSFEELFIESYEVGKDEIDFDHNDVVDDECVMEHSFEFNGDTYSVVTPVGKDEVLAMFKVDLNTGDVEELYVK